MLRYEWILLVVLFAQEPSVPVRERPLQDPALVAEEIFQALVTSVEDGDSLVVKPLAGGETAAIHLSGVDAPEMSQPSGPEAKAFLSQLALGRTVTVRLKNSIERLAQIEIDGSDVSVALVRKGMAWHCPRYAEERELTDAEAEARRSKRGLWGRAHPTPPWIYRGVGACWQQKKGRAALDRPDFSGTWTAVSPADRAGQKLTIKQDASSLTLELVADRDLESLVYKLEGTTSRAFSTAEGPVDIVAKSRWSDGAWIVDERRWMVRGEEAINVRRVLWLDDRGLLNVEVSSPRPIGEVDVTRLVLKREERR